jgi:ubiquinone/menaquinone biosynthesis C-methylase UbiE
MNEHKPGHRWFAAFYDLLSRVSERGAFGRMRRDLLSDVAGDVVEIGAGTGSNFAYYPAAARVVAVEPDPHMAKRAERKLAALGRDNIELRLAPAEHLPLPDATCDVAVSTLVLCTVADVPRSLAEVRRVLRPGGELRFIEHVRGGPRLARVQRAVQPVWGWCGGGCRLDRDTEAAIRDAGFEITDIRRTRLAPWLPAIIGKARRV